MEWEVNTWELEINSEVGHRLRNIYKMEKWMTENYSLLGENWETWKPSSPITQPNLCSCLLCFLSCVQFCWQNRAAHVKVKLFNSNIQYRKHYRLCSSNSTQFPLTSYLQQVSAQLVNQVPVDRLKSYQLYLFLSPCYHSSLLSLTNHSLSSLISLMVQRSSATSLPPPFSHASTHVLGLS